MSGMSGRDVEAAMYVAQNTTPEQRAQGDHNTPIFNMILEFHCDDLSALAKLLRQVKLERSNLKQSSPAMGESPLWVVLLWLLVWSEAWCLVQ
jgi:hypothetical protein